MASKQFDPKKASSPDLPKISFRLPQGAKVVILTGWTGAGKTRTLRGLGCIRTDEGIARPGSANPDRSVTEEITHYCLDEEKNLWILDVPGLGDTGPIGEEARRKAIREQHRLRLLNYLLDMSSQGIETLSTVWIATAPKATDDTLDIVRYIRELTQGDSNVGGWANVIVLARLNSVANCDSVHIARAAENAVKHLDNGADACHSLKIFSTCYEPSFEFQTGQFTTEPRPNTDDPPARDWKYVKFGDSELSTQEFRKWFLGILPKDPFPIFRTPQKCSTCNQHKDIRLMQPVCHDGDISHRHPSVEENWYHEGPSELRHGKAFPAGKNFIQKVAEAVAETAKPFLPMFANAADAYVKLLESDGDNREPEAKTCRDCERRMNETGCYTLWKCCQAVGGSAAVPKSGCNGDPNKKIRCNVCNKTDSEDPLGCTRFCKPKNGGDEHRVFQDNGNITSYYCMHGDAAIPAEELHKLESLNQ